MSKTHLPTGTELVTNHAQHELWVNVVFKIGFDHHRDSWLYSLKHGKNIITKCFLWLGKNPFHLQKCVDGNDHSKRLTLLWNDIFTNWYNKQHISYFKILFQDFWSWCTNQKIAQQFKWIKRKSVCRTVNPPLKKRRCEDRNTFLNILVEKLFYKRE